MPKRKTGEDENTSHKKIKSTFTEEELSIDVHNKSLPCVIGLPGGPINPTAVLLTHGAGGDLHHAQLQYISHYLALRGHVVLRFTCKGLNIGYRSKMYHGVLSFMKSVASKYGVKQCILCGRSMGSRAAVNVCNDLADDPVLQQFVTGVLCLAYPLHPPGKLDNLRDEPLKQLKSPVLFVSGTRDEMANVDLMERVTAQIPGPVTMKWLTGVDHGHKNKGGQGTDLESDICNTVHDWIRGM